MAQNNNNNNNNNYNQWSQGQPNKLQGAEDRSEPRAYSYANKDDIYPIIEKSQHIRNAGILTLRQEGKVEPVKKRVLDPAEQAEIENQKKREAEQRRLLALNTKVLPPNIWSLIESYAAKDLGMKRFVFFDFDPVGTTDPFMESNTRDVYMVDTSRYDSMIEIGGPQSVFPRFAVKRCQEAKLDLTAYLRPQHSGDYKRKSDMVTAQMLVTKIGPNAFLTYHMHTWWHIAVFHFESDQDKKKDQEEKCKFVATTFLHETGNPIRPSLNPLPLGFAAPHFNRRIAAIIQLQNKDLLALGPIVEERYGEIYDDRIGASTFPSKDNDPHFYQSFADRLVFDENVIITSRQWKKIETGRPLNPNRMAFKAVQLNDGRVLIMGGYTSLVVQEMRGEHVINVAKTTNTCEYFDLDLMQFSNGPSLPEEGNGLSLGIFAQGVDDPNEGLHVMPLNELYFRELMFDAIKLSDGNVLFSGAGAIQTTICLLEFYKDGVYDPNPQWTVLEGVQLEMNINMDLCHNLVELNREYVAIVYKTRALSNLQDETFEPESNYAVLLNMKTRKIEETKILCWKSSDGFYGVGAI